MIIEFSKLSFPKGKGEGRGGGGSTCNYWWSGLVMIGGVCRYTQAVIRICFPDLWILQGSFRPGENCTCYPWNVHYARWFHASL